VICDSTGNAAGTPTARSSVVGIDTVAVVLPSASASVPIKARSVGMAGRIAACAFAIRRIVVTPNRTRQGSHQHDAERILPMAHRIRGGMIGIAPSAYPVRHDRNSGIRIRIKIQARLRDWRRRLRPVCDSRRHATSCRPVVPVVPVAIARSCHPVVPPCGATLWCHPVVPPCGATLWCRPGVAH
jgi:hypothetical protein